MSLGTPENSAIQKLSIIIIIIVSFMALWNGLGISNSTKEFSEVCFDLLHLLSGLHCNWWEVLHEPHGLSGCVLGGSN